VDVSAAFHAADIPERKEAMDDVERVIWDGPMDAHPSSWLFGYGNRSVPLLLSFHAVCVLSFLAWLSIDRDLKPNTCSGYLSAVRFMLNRSNIDTSFMETNTHIKSTKTGMWIAYRCTHPEADEKTQPFTLDLIMLAWSRYLDVKNKAEDYVMLIAMLTAYVCLLRKSEYLDETTTDHHLLAESVWFEVEHPVGSGRLMQVPSMDCHKFDRRGMRDVTLDVRSAKNDEGGAGHRFTCTRVDLATSTRPFDLAQELWDFACEARPVRGLAFLTWQGKFRLTYAKFNAKIKQVAQGAGFDPRGYHTHSLRVAGASALAARGVPDHVIQTMGRWKSLAFLTYIRLSTTAYNEAVDKLCDLRSLTIEDVRKMMPSMKRVRHEA